MPASSGGGGGGAIISAGDNRIVSGGGTSGLASTANNTVPQHHSFPQNHVTHGVLSGSSHSKKLSSSGLAEKGKGLLASSGHHHGHGHSAYNSSGKLETNFCL